MKKRNVGRGVCLGLAVLLCAAMIQPLQAKDIKEANQEKQKLESSLSEAQDLIDSLKDNKQDIEATIDQLDTKLTTISEQIVKLKKQLSDKNEELTQVQAELSEAEKNKNEQYDRMKMRIKFLYENYGCVNYITMLLSCDSFSDFINQAGYMAEITSYDRTQLQEYQKTQTTITEAKDQIRQDKADLEAMEKQVESDQKAADLLLEEKKTQLADVKTDLSDTETQAAELEAEIQTQNDLIAQIKAAEAAAKKAEEEAAAKAEQEKKAEEKQEAQSEEDTSKKDTEEDKQSSSSDTPNINTSHSYTGGQFTWPCPSSSRVTSDFGYRNSPTAGASSYHKGIDIGASYGSAIVSAADGVVFTTDYQPSGAGNYVVISHGGGIYTVYMHCSSLAVSSGEKVKRGETIAYVGSTGVSTGNHLHFGVQVNGEYVNPWNYLN